MIPVVWMACNCTCWPLTPAFGLSRCGSCGVRPHSPCSNLDGKAYAL